MSARPNALPWHGVYDSLNIEVPELDARPLGEFLERHAAERPAAIALQYFDCGINYRELSEQVNRCANALTALGVDRDSVVGIHLPNIPQYVIVLLACAKIGCAGSGVSPLLTPGELQHQVQDAGIEVLVTLDGLIAALRGREELLVGSLDYAVVTNAEYHLTGVGVENIPTGTLSMLDYGTLLEAAAPSFLQVPVSGEDTMMVQYTGGTTGRPKGAELTVQNLMYNPLQYSAYEPWSVGREVVATAFPFFHGAGLAFTIATIRFGATLFLIPDPRNLEYFCDLMKRFPPTRLAAVPSLYQMLFDHPSIADVDFSGLKTAYSGAAPLAGSSRTNIESVIGQGKLSDLFGMTETGPVHVCNPPSRAVPTSVGIPVPGADTRIVDLDAGTEEMPPGEPGEIITSGPQVMKGYLNLPDESAKALRQWRGKTWMYTGDVGYMDEEGYIYLCDRAKDMLIVGGYKVFSVEVEDKLQGLGCVQATAVVGTPDDARPGNDVVNLCVEVSPAHIDRVEADIAEEISAYCRENMAPYKVPRHIHFVDHIPLTSVGKIDKKALRASLLGDV